MIKIRDTHGEVLYETSTASTMKQAVLEAFEGFVDLKYADLSNQDLRGLRLADVDDGNYSGGRTGQGRRFTYAKFDGADLTDAQFHHLDCRGASFVGSNLTGTKWRFTNLDGASMRGAMMEDASMHDCDIEDVDFTGAYVRGLDLERVHTTQAHRLNNPNGVTLDDEIFAEAQSEGPFIAQDTQPALFEVRNTGGGEPPLVSQHVTVTPGGKPPGGLRNHAEVEHLDDLPDAGVSGTGPIIVDRHTRTTKDGKKAPVRQHTRKRQ